MLKITKINRKENTKILCSPIKNPKQFISYFKILTSYLFIYNNRMRIINHLLKCTHNAQFIL